MSLAEAVANVMVGYSLAVLTQMLVFPLFGLPAHISDRAGDRRHLHRVMPSSA